MNTDWQRRRSAFNHDWLKNRFLIGIGSFQRILAGEVENRETEIRFIRETLPQWPQRQAEVAHLVDNFETEMSPRNLFQCSPLNCCGPATTSWLPDLVHRLWRHRVQVDTLCSDARDALGKANDAYIRVAEVITVYADGNIEAVNTVRGRLDAFRAACEEVSSSISKFPDRVEVI